MVCKLLDKQIISQHYHKETESKDCLNKMEFTLRPWRITSVLFEDEVKFNNIVK